MSASTPIVLLFEPGGACTLGSGLSSLILGDFEFDVEVLDVLSSGCEVLVLSASTCLKSVDNSRRVFRTGSPAASTGKVVEGGLLSSSTW